MKIKKIKDTIVFKDKDLLQDELGKSPEEIMELESRKYTDQMKTHEDKLKLAGVELKKKLEQTRSEMGQQYKVISRERERFENVLNGSPDLILTMDQHSKIIYLNKSAEKFWNLKHGQHIGKSIRELFPGETDDYDSFIVSLFNPDTVKITGESKKVKIRDEKGSWQAAEMLLSLSELSDEVSYTAFISLI